MRIKDIMSTTRLMSFNSLTLHYFHTYFMSSHVLVELASVFFTARMDPFGLDGLALHAHNLRHMILRDQTGYALH